MTHPWLGPRKCQVLPVMLAEAVGLRLRRWISALVVEHLAPGLGPGALGRETRLAGRLVSSKSASPISFRSFPNRAEQPLELSQQRQTRRACYHFDSWVLWVSYCLASARISFRGRAYYPKSVKWVSEQLRPGTCVPT